MAGQHGFVGLMKAMVLVSASCMVGQATAEEFVVKLKTGSQGFGKQARTLSVKRGMKILDAHATGGLVKIEVDSSLSKESQAQILAELYRDSIVEYVVPNVKMHAFQTPNDPKFSEQWSHRVSNSVAGWDMQRGSRDVVVAVIDTGINITHEDLKANIWTNSKEVAGNGIDDDNNGYIDDVNGWDFHTEDNNPDDETSDKNPGHGTHCAGIIGAAGNNAIGVTGVSQQVSLMPIRFLGADGSGDLMKSVKAIDYAIANGAHIISASWGAAVSADMAKPIVEAIARAHEKGVVFIAAAANDGKNNDKVSMFPANTDLPNMIAVAASSEDDSKPEWSNFGLAKVHVAAPGHKILSTIPGNGYKDLSGTSMATPFVSGLAALMMAQHGSRLDGLTLRSLLQTSGAAVKIETACECRVDVAAALKSVSDKKLTLVPAALTVAPNATAQFSAWSANGALKFASSNSDIATIDDKGVLTGKAVGETQITVTDANNTSAKSLRIRIAEKEEEESSCPLGDPMICMFMCIIAPELPWCEGT